MMFFVCVIFFKLQEWKLFKGDRLHYLFLLCYLSQFNVEPDELHVLHLGVTGYFLGSIFWLLTFEGRASPQSNLDLVWKHIVEFYKTHKTSNQYTAIAISMFCGDNVNNSYPKLKGKGIELKHMVPALAYAFEKMCDTSIGCST